MTLLRKYVFKDSLDDPIYLQTLVVAIFEYLVYIALVGSKPGDTVGNTLANAIVMVQ